MKKITAKRNPDHYVLQEFIKPRKKRKILSAKESDCSKLISDNTIIYDSEKPDVPLIIYLNIGKEVNHMLPHLRSIKYNKDVRTSSLITTARIFGYQPRQPLRGKNFCNGTMLAEEHPAAHKAACDFAVYLDKVYKEHCPDVYNDHVEISNKVKPHWHIENTPFTSGIINYDNPLPYHNDFGNFQNVYSNMVCVTNNIKGGNLAIPEYDVTLNIKNGSIVLFDGQKIVHGVTPIIKIGEPAYRYTLVYYTLQQMWHCLSTPAEEIKRGQMKSDERILRKVQRLTGVIANEVGHEYNADGSIKRHGGNRYDGDSWRRKNK